MATIPDHKSPKKRAPRKSKGNWATEEEEIFSGRVKLFRTNQSGKIWQMRVWFKSNDRLTKGQYFRKSLRTPDLDEAKLEAEELYLDLRSKMRNGEIIFEKTTKELVEEYLEHREKDINIHITKARWSAIRSQMKHYLSFVGENIKINSIPAHTFDGYHKHRKSYAPTVKLLTLANEASTIKNFYRYGIQRKLINPDCLPLFPKINKRSSTEQIGVIVKCCVQ
ncbi:MAG: hypothetical protein HN790_04675, partial [Methylococcales bacterium]|nr:hypothetical protein [Methylococcales bacterium]